MDIAPALRGHRTEKDNHFIIKLDAYKRKHLVPA